MRRLKVFGALLSAAALAVTMPMSAFAAGTGTDEIERIDTSGWVQIDNALPQKGDVISMTITLPTESEMKGISGIMKSVDGAVAVSGPDAVLPPDAAAPTQQPTVTPSKAPTPSPSAAQSAQTTQSAQPSQTVTPSASAVVSEAPSATAAPSPSSSQTVTANPSVEPSGSPSESATPGSSDEPSETPSQSPSATASDDAASTPEPGESVTPDPVGSASPAATPSDAAGDEAPETKPSDELENGGDTQDETPDLDQGDVNNPEGEDDQQANRMASRDGSTSGGWDGLLSDDDLFIVLSADKEINSAKRYFMVTAEPGEAVTFEFSGRYSDGKGDHRFVATHKFQVAAASMETTNRIAVSAGSVRTIDGSDLEFRIWPSEVTTLEGMRPTSSVQAGTSPAELLRSLSMPEKTTARVYRGDTGIPRLSGVCTGDTVQFKDKTARSAGQEAIAVVRGDLLGTGKLGLNQLVAMSKTLAGQVPLDEANLLAADVDGDGKVTPADASALKKLVKGRQ